MKCSKAKMSHCTLLTYTSKPISLQVLTSYTLQFERYGQDKFIKIKVTTARSKVKSRSYYDAAHLHPLTKVSQCLYQDSTSYLLWFMRYSKDELLLKLARPLGSEITQLPTLTPIPG